MFDVTVIGAGPAGSATAIRCAESGMNVELFEQMRFPRSKLCGGFLSPECLPDLDHFGILSSLKAAGAVPIHRTQVSSPWGALAEAPLPGTGLSVSRCILDAQLLDAARRHGVQVKEGLDGFVHPHAAPWTVIAAGRKVSPPGWAQGIPYYGLQALFDDVEEMTDQVALDLIPGGYVGLVRQEGSRVNVCALTASHNIRHSGPNLDHVLHEMTHQNAILRRKLKHAQRVSDWRSIGPVRMGFRRLTGPQQLFVGDAACVVDPFAGEGIAMGIRSGVLIQKALASVTHIEATYRRLWHDQFDSARMVGAHVRRVLQSRVLQDVGVWGLQRFPFLLNWLTEHTRPAAERPVYDVSVQ